MPSAVRPPSARERIGGRWAVSRGTFVVAVLLTIPIAFLRPADVVGGAPLWTAAWVEIVLAQCALIGVWLLIADRTILRRRRIRPVPIWVVVAVSGVIGPLRIVPAVVLAPDAPTVFSTDQPIASVATFVAIVALNALTCPVVAYVLATRDWYVTERARLLALEVDAEERRLRAVGALDAMRDLAVRATDRDVRDVQSDARAALAATSDPVRAADALLAAARTGVRPLGHALASTPEEASGRTTHVSIAAVTAAFLRRRPLPIAVPLGIFAIVAVPRIYIRLPALEATVTALLAIAGVIVVFLGARPIVRRLPRFAIPLAVVACLLAVLPASIARDAFSDSGIARPLFTIGIALFTALFATGMVLAASDTAADLLRSLRVPLERADVERLALERARVDLERELGRHLHASVQSGLVAASYAIQDAVARGDVEAQDAALRAARSLLDERIEVGDGHAGDDAVDLRAEVARAWATIVDVRWEPDPPPAAACTRDVLRLLRECLSNAVIHGHARHAVIRIRATPETMLVEVEDDGVGPTGGDAGLGSAVLDDLTGGAWSIDAAADGVGAITRAELTRLR